MIYMYLIGLNVVLWDALISRQQRRLGVRTALKYCHFKILFLNSLGNRRRKGTAFDFMPGTGFRERFASVVRVDVLGIPDILGVISPAGQMLCSFESMKLGWFPVDFAGHMFTTWRFEAGLPSALRNASHKVRYWHTQMGVPCCTPQIHTKLQKTGASTIKGGTTDCSG